MEKQNSTIILNPEGTSSEEVPLVGGGSFDVAESVAHELRKQRKRERYQENEKHNAPVVRHNQKRQEREISRGNFADARKQIVEVQASRYEAVQAELAKSGGQRSSYEYEAKKFRDLFEFLDENDYINPSVETKFSSIDDKKQRLRYILSLPIIDKANLLHGNQFKSTNYDDFERQLLSRQDFIDDAVEPRDVLLDLNRASLRATMISTPEYSAYRMAKQISKSRHVDEKADYPKISGCESNVDSESIGDWAEIIDEYATLETKIAKRNPGLSPEELEYKTIHDVAHIFAKSMEYQPSSHDEHSSYVSSFHESVAWAQLGEGVQARLRGMRQKIGGIDLHNIERFIGKSSRSEHYNSIADKAIDLHFAIGNDRFIDWINDTPFEIIKHAHQRLRSNMEKDEILRLALTEIFSQQISHDAEPPKDSWSATIDFFQKQGVYDPEQRMSLVQQINSINYEFSNDDESSDLFFRRLDVFRGVADDDGIETARGLLDKDMNFNQILIAKRWGMSMETALNFPWLIWQYNNAEVLTNNMEEARSFPLGKNESARHRWCSEHSFVHLDGCWGRQTLGKFIYTRLQAGVDKVVARRYAVA